MSSFLALFVAATCWGHYEPWRVETHPAYCALVHVHSYRMGGIPECQSQAEYKETDEHYPLRLLKQVRICSAARNADDGTVMGRFLVHLKCDELIEHLLK